MPLKTLHKDFLCGKVVSQYRQASHSTHITSGSRIKSQYSIGKMSHNACNGGYGKSLKNIMRKSLLN